MPLSQLSWVQSQRPYDTVESEGGGQMKQCRIKYCLLSTIDGRVNIFNKDVRMRLGGQVFNNFVRDLIRRFFFSMIFQMLFNYKSRPPGALEICKCCFILKYLES
jgi:hypothetical protein